MKNKKGFTLIELLAIIVILGIIALLIVPAVTDVITDSEKDITARSAENYVKAVNQALIKRLATGSVENGDYDLLEGGDVCLGTKTDDTICSGEKLQIKTDGGKVADGKIRVENSEVIDYSIKIDDYVANYDPSTKTVTVTDGRNVGL